VPQSGRGAAPPNHPRDSGVHLTELSKKPGLASWFCFAVGKYK
jgi:hypothetical protein